MTRIARMRAVMKRRRSMAAKDRIICRRVPEALYRQTKSSMAGMLTFDDMLNAGRIGEHEFLFNILQDVLVEKANKTLSRKQARKKKPCKPSK